MSRERLIHESIWQSRQFVRCSLCARLLFIGIVTTADDQGRRTADSESLKLDIFIPQDRDFDRQALERRRLDSLEIDKPAEYYLSSPEDVILAKFEWYRKGGRVSERQWNDILGVFKVQGEALDMNYLRRWALTLGVQDLLEEALTSVSSA